MACSCSRFDLSSSLLVARSLLRDTQLAVSGVALFVVFVLSIISRRVAINACCHQCLVSISACINACAYQCLSDLEKMSWRRNRNGGTNTLADELLRSLFASQSGASRPRQQRPTWKCKICTYQNWMDRKVCRSCKCAKDHTNNSPSQRVRTHQPQMQKPVALAPWASAGMVQERADHVERAISAAKQAGGCNEAVSKLETELKQQQKRAVAPTSILRNVEGTKKIIERAGKRHDALCEQIEALKTREQEARIELEEARVRLQAMEAEAFETLQGKPPVINYAEALTDAVRTLLVTMHRHEAPAQVNEAMAIVTRFLPEEPPSEELTEDPVDRGLTRPLPPDMDATIEEFDMVDDEDEEALIAMARRLKRARRTSPH